MACRGRRAHDDRGSTYVLEAILLTLILLGAAYSVTALRDTGAATVQPREKLEALTNDALIVLDGLREDRGRLMDVYLAEAIHCASATTAAVEGGSCDGVRGANISLKFETYLPDGAGYAYGIGNGIAQRILYRAYLPEGETVTSSRAIVPDWNLTFLAADLSCYEAGMLPAVEAVPIWHARAATPADLNVTVDGVNATASKDVDGVWRATFANATPSAGVIHADANATDATYPGATAYGTCDLGGDGPALREAWGSATFAPAAATAGAGGTASIAYDVGSLAGVAGATVEWVNVSVFAPVPPHETAADAYARVAHAMTALDHAGSYEWNVPPDTLFGLHPLLLTASVKTANGGVVELHRVGLIDVALPTGEVPIDPPYRVFLQAWFPDWR